MTRLLASSVVRGKHQEDSYGGLYLIDIDQQSVRQTVDLNTDGIDWRGRGREKGLRGIAFDGDRIFVIASDELFAYTPDFELIGSWRNQYLKHCRGIAVFERSLFIVSSGFDSILAFNLDSHKFDWAMHIQTRQVIFGAVRFDPESDDGPIMLDKLNINSIYCSADGMYITGNGGMLYFNGKSISMSAELPIGSHNAQPFRDGVLFNDSHDSVLRYSGRGEGEEDRAMAIPRHDPKIQRHKEWADDQALQPGFARGLCVLNDHIVAGGSSPSTVTLYDLAANTTLLSVSLSMDSRNSIHGLEVWPFD